MTPFYVYKRALERFESGSVKCWYRAILLIGCIILIVARAPNLLLHPRFWAEEGALYFAYVYNNPWYVALVKPHNGYYSFLNIAACFIALLLPIKFAPYATTYIAFLIQIIPFWIIIYGNSYCWDTLFKKIVSCLLVVFSPAASGGIWLNLTCIHFYLCLIVFLILLEPADGISRIKHKVYGVLLLIGGLTSVVSAFLAPVFLLSARKEKNRERTRQAILLCVCLGVQIVAFGYEIIIGDIGTRAPFSLYRFLHGFISYGMVMPLFGEWGVVRIVPIVDAWILKTGGGNGYILAKYAAVIIAFISTILVIGNKNNDKRARRIFFKSAGSFFSVIVISLIFSINGAGGMRYSYAPGIMLMFCFFAFLYGRKSARIVATLLIAISLSYGISYYDYNMCRFNIKEWPDWTQEVESWLHNPNRPIRIWPPPWKISLKKGSGNSRW